MYILRKLDKEMIEKLNERSLIRIELTNYELEQAFQIKEEEYLNEDIENMLQSMYESECITKEEYIALARSEVITEISNRYEDTCSYNLEYNITIQEAIKYVLERVEETSKNIQC